MFQASLVLSNVFFPLDLNPDYRRSGVFTSGLLALYTIYNNFYLPLRHHPHHLRPHLHRPHPLLHRRHHHHLLRRHHRLVPSLSLF